MQESTYAVEAGFDARFDWKRRVYVGVAEFSLCDGGVSERLEMMNEGMWGLSHAERDFVFVWRPSFDKLFLKVS